MTTIFTTTDIIHPNDADLVDRRAGSGLSRMLMDGTDVRLLDVCRRFADGESIATLAADYEVTQRHVEAAVRTVARSL